MNRHERRKQKAQARHAGPDRRYVTFEMTAENRAMVKACTIDNPAFVKGVERLRELYVEWRRAHPKARPQWHPNDGMLITGPLKDGEMQSTLAANDAAAECIAWLDEQTEHRADILQARCAVESIDEQAAQMLAERTRYTSRGFAMVEAFANDKGTTTRTPQSACPHCGAAMNAASAGDDAVPSPGALVLCVTCGGCATFADDLTIRHLTDAEWASVSEEQRRHLQDAGAIFQATRTRALAPNRKVDA